jgi:Protein of unknown function (DUF1553)/Protein of unknown function (DUF1549)/Planctomycete cytochrome C
MAVIVMAVGVSVRAEDSTPEQLKFFEEKVRPLLANRCYECHTAAKKQGDVRLDLRASVFPELVVPGQPDQSRLLQVLKYDPNDTQMPPKGKLPQGEIDLLTEWVKQGAPWPADAPMAAHAAAGFPKRENGEIDFHAAAQSHWAYRAIARPVPPAVATLDRVHTPVDRFILAKLEQQQLALSPEADRATFIRRLYADLLGIRPTFDEIEAHVTDTSPTANADLVDRLLASPKFGEKWGRLWLDIARYADTKGYVFTEERRYPFSYTYRDYVVSAFNSDKPYDRFLIEQLAADQLDLPTGDPALAAMGFLTVGPRFLNDTHSIIDDRIDVVTRGVMGMTLGCARCHDHKYDPLPTQDYYSLYGVFASSREPERLPQVGTADTSAPEYKQFAAELAKREKDVANYLDGVHVEMTMQARNRVGDFLLTIAQQAKLVPAGVELKIAPPLREKLIERWEQYIQQQTKSKNRVWFAFAQLRELPADGFPTAALDRMKGWSPEQCHPALLKSLQDQPPQDIVEVVRLYGRVLDEVRERWEREKASAPELTALPDADAEQLRQVLYGAESPGAIPRDQIERIIDRDQRDHAKELKKKVAEWMVTSPGSPPHGMVLVDNDNPMEPVVFERGNPGRRGPRVPRRMPRIVAGNESPSFKIGSGRLELARSIASPENPLTARVFVNRVWLQLFGNGLVNTPSDFGVRTDPPTHPELLDWLSTRFIDSGWSTKTLIREVVLSSTYRQSIFDHVKARELDPENRLLWRQNRRRFQFEQMRDSLLAAAGVLDDRMAGRPVEIETQPFSHRRSIYAYIDRNNFSGLLRTFDYPSPDTSNPQRPQTVVPQQALFGLNSPFIEELSKSAAQRASGVNPAEQIDSLFRVVLARSPAPEEASWSVAYLTRHPDGLWQVAQVLLLSNEFQFAE